MSTFLLIALVLACVAVLFVRSAWLPAKAGAKLAAVKAAVAKQIAAAP